MRSSSTWPCPIWRLRQLLDGALACPRILVLSSAVDYLGRRLTQAEAMKELSFGHTEDENDEGCHTITYSSACTHQRALYHRYQPAEHANLRSFCVKKTREHNAVREMKFLRCWLFCSERHMSFILNALLGMQSKGHLACFA